MKYLKCRKCTIKSDRHCTPYVTEFIRDNIKKRMKMKKYHRKKDLDITLSDENKLKIIQCSQSTLLFDRLWWQLDCVPRYQFMWIDTDYTNKDYYSHAAGVVIDNTKKVFKVFDAHGKTGILHKIYGKILKHYNPDFKFKFVNNICLQNNKLDSFCQIYVAAWFNSIVTRTETKYLKNIQNASSDQRIEACMEFYNNMIDEI